MAARKRRGTLDKPWEDAVRQKIQSSMLINRLTDFVKGEVELTAPQVTAALGLLRKSVPDLTSTEHSGQIDTRTVMELPPVADNKQSWVERHKPKPPTIQ